MTFANCAAAPGIAAAFIDLTEKVVALPRGLTEDGVLSEGERLDQVLLGAIQLAAR
ncbi:MAG: hypothetical protein HY329_04435 [Chloroflexi bacterium]|nr:hypothetical protein [Chloroflexota bacterium]